MIAKLPRQKSKKMFSVSAILCGLLVLFHVLFAFGLEAQSSANVGSTASKEATAPSALAAVQLPGISQAKYCPLAKELTKANMHWQVGRRWQSYSDSFSSGIRDFIGAQWYGVRLGKIICLYRGDVEFEFSVALEQRANIVVKEPTGQHWSGLVDDRKFCSSTNVFDCPFFSVVTESTTDAYEEIKYQHQVPSPTMQRDINF